MRPAERWPAILLQLEPDAWTRATDLAQALGVSERTVYRDVQAMVEAGVPLQGVPGKGYRVPDDYLVAPVTLTTDEAVMLILGSAYAAQNVDGRHQAAARSARHKLEERLPAEHRERAQSLQGGASLVPPHVFGPSSEDGLLPRVRQAVVEERVLEVTPEGPDSSYRLHPYGLVQRAGAWHIVGHAPARGRAVHRRLSGVADLTLTDAHFDRPAGYRAASDPPAAPDRTVRVAFATAVAPEVRVPPSLQVASRERPPEGPLLLTLAVDDERTVLPWLLGWGRHVRVLEPRSLRERLAAEARATADQYKSAPTLLDTAGNPST